MLLATDSERVRVLLASLPSSRPRRVLRSIRELPDALEDANVRSVLCEPNGVSEAFLMAMIGRAESQGRQFFFTSVPTTRATELVLRLADRGLAGALLCDCESDRRFIMRQLTAETVECTLALRLLGELRLPLLTLPLPLREAVVRVAASRCLAGSSVGQLAQQVGGSPRSIARWLAAAGLAQPRTMLAAFRLAHLWPDWSSPTLTLPVLAEVGGFRSARTLRAQSHKILGWSPSLIWRSRTEEDVLSGLTRALTRSLDCGVQETEPDDIGAATHAELGCVPSIARSEYSHFG